jgi:hypothetical protein
MADPGLVPTPVILDVILLDLLISPVGMTETVLDIEAW